MAGKHQNVVLFIDCQNMYKGARSCFFPQDGHYTCGQFQPLALGELICSRPPPGFARHLAEVRVYTGQPNPNKDQKGYSASRRQYAAWQKLGINVISRPLRYPPNYPQEKAQEKGIDVQLAIDFIALALEGAYDVGIIASTDTDLIPAIDFVITRCGHERRVEVTAWSSRQHRNPCLRSTIASIWAHWLSLDDYEKISDHRDYIK